MIIKKPIHIIPIIFMLVASIFFIGAIIDSNFMDKPSTTLKNLIKDKNLTNGYILCRRHLRDDSYPFNPALYDTNDNDNKLEHHHFFSIRSILSLPKKNQLSPIENNKFKNQIDNSCTYNHFSNFGFYGDSSIYCKEDIADYYQCNDTIYNENDILIALKKLDNSNDLVYNTKDKNQYNCQTFAKHVIAISINKNIKSDVSLHNSTFTKIWNSFLYYLGYSDKNKTRNFSYHWITNDYYRKL